MQYSILAILTIVLMMSASQAGAEQKEAPSDTVARVADIIAGTKIAGRCAGCHGMTGVSLTDGIPHLAGQHADYIVNALKGYRDGSRAGEIMAAMKVVVADLSEADMINVAEYYSSLKPFAYAPAQVSAAKETGDQKEDPFAAAKAQTEVCAECHGAEGNSVIPGMPSVAGQYAKYLVMVMKAYRDGGRENEIMQAFSAALSDGDIELIAKYYASIAPKKAAAPDNGDPVAGAASAVPCAGCHGPDGNSTDPASPRLAGLDAPYLVAAINGYTNETRDNTLMRDLVAELSETDIANIAAFYARRTPKAPPQPIRLTAEEWAIKCDRCHGVDGNSADSPFPILAGQREDYLFQALQFYHGGLRHDSTMQAMSFVLDDVDMLSLARHYSSKREN